MNKTDKIVAGIALGCQGMVVLLLIVLGNMNAHIPGALIKIYGAAMLTVFLVIARRLWNKKLK